MCETTLVAQEVGSIHTAGVRHLSRLGGSQGSWVAGFRQIARLTSAAQARTPAHATVIARSSAVSVSALPVSP